jgi:hypothetical protein
MICHYAEFRISFIIIMLSVIMLNVILLSVIMLGVVSPYEYTIGA